MPDIMVDIETYGKKAGCVILSIGAVTFKVDGKSHIHEFYRNICINDSLIKGFKVDQDTFNWWAGQPAEARKQFSVDPEPIEKVFKDFVKWFNDCKGEKVWCQGTAFDIPILSEAFFMLKIKEPWKFWNVRDTRTYYDAKGYNPLLITRQGTYHNALDDAAHQVRCVQGAYRNVCA